MRPRDWMKRTMVAAILCGVLAGCAGAPSGKPATAPPIAPEVPATPPQIPAPALHDVAITVTVPEGTGPVFLPGNLPELGPWAPDKFAMQGTGTTRTARLRVPAGTRLEYKFTLGDWATEGLGPSGTVLPNNVLEVTGDMAVQHDIPGFRIPGDQYLQHLRDNATPGLFGRLVHWESVASQHLERTRHVSVWLPPGYDADPVRRYPVLYMHDGQNLFDPRIANTGTDWGVDESITRLLDAGRIEPPIVVAVFNTDLRLREYSPWDLGPAYGRFLIEELKPRVDGSFRTLPGAGHTAVMGSSMGGLISFHLARTRPDIFGAAGCVSTHWPWNGDVTRQSHARGIIEAELAKGMTFPKGVHVYFDYGTAGVDAKYEPYQQQVTAWMRTQGLEEGRDFIVKKFDGADHNEAAWRARLDEPMEFLFGK